MSNIKDMAPYSFFAASNSFDGFTSYFNTCFSPYSFDKIYILKGGPGTGKSSLMKRLSQFAKENNFFREEIYCSSDRYSLDGIIIECQKGRVAMLDGTAPHDTDAVIPGAVDEIINLGEFWCSEILEESKKDITALNQEKNKAYSKAYEELANSAVFCRKNKAEIGKRFDYKAADESISLMIRALYREGRGEHRVRLISAFGKDGEIRLDTLDNISNNIFSVIGYSGEEYTYMNLLTKNLIKTDCDFYILPSPLDKNNTEAIYIPATQTTVLCGGKSENKIYASDFIKKDNGDILKEEIDFNNEMTKLFLNRAKEQFKLASKYHFELEKIYSPTVDFHKIDKIFETVSEKIIKILS